MVVRKKKKSLKKRGERTQGYGHHKRHRGGGSRGGRGKAGLQKHKKMYAIKHMPDHFGKKGFKRPSAVVKKHRSINLNELDAKIEEFLREKKVTKSKDGIKVNLSTLGYDKLLGTGQLKHKLIVKAKYFSKTAIKKLEKNKGKAIAVGE